MDKTSNLQTFDKICSVRNRSSILIIIFLFTIALRLLFVTIRGFEEPTKDAASYDSIGWNLVKGLGYMNTSKNPVGEISLLISPGYPYFLAFVYRLFGHQYFPVLVIQAIFSGLIGIFVFFLGQSLSTTSVGFLASFLWAVYPRDFLYSTSLLTETLFTFVLASFMVVLWFCLSRKGWGWYLLAGGLLGILNLTRPVFLLFPLFLLVYLICFERNRSVLFKWLALMLVMSAVITPWTIRNYRLTGLLMPVRSIGSLFWISVSGDVSNNGIPSDLSQQPDLDPANLESTLIQRSFRVLFSNPIPLIRAAGTKFGILWGITPESSVDTSIFRLAQYLAWLIFLLLSTWGAILFFRRNRVSLYLIMPILYVSGLHLLLHVDGRYREPYIPYLILFTSLAVITIFEILFGPRASHKQISAK